MWASAITAYFHYLGLMLAFGALVVESQTLKQDMSLQEAWRVLIADGIYGVSATLILVTGVLRVMYFGKGTDYYLSNPFFYVKIGIFILVSVLSLYPTFSFVSWLKRLQNKEAPELELRQVQWLSWLIRGELMGFIVIPLLAAMMARGTQIF